MPVLCARLLARPAPRGVASIYTKVLHSDIFWVAVHHTAAAAWLTIHPGQPVQCRGWDSVTRRQHRAAAAAAGLITQARRLELSVVMSPIHFITNHPAQHHTSLIDRYIYIAISISSTFNYLYLHLWNTSRHKEVGNVHCCFQPQCPECPLPAARHFQSLDTALPRLGTNESQY